MMTVIVAGTPAAIGNYVSHPCLSAVIPAHQRVVNSSSQHATKNVAEDIIVTNNIDSTLCSSAIKVMSKSDGRIGVIRLNFRLKKNYSQKTADSL